MSSDCLSNHSTGWYGDTDTMLFESLNLCNLIDCSSYAIVFPNIVAYWSWIRCWSLVSLQLNIIIFATDNGQFLKINCTILFLLDIYLSAITVAIAALRNTTAFAGHLAWAWVWVWHHWRRALRFGKGIWHTKLRRKTLFSNKMTLIKIKFIFQT